MSRLIHRILAWFGPGSPGQTCPGCGAPFRCGISLKGCWCKEVNLSPDALRQLRSRHRGCLCRDCLEKVAVNT